MGLKRQLDYSQVARSDVLFCKKNFATSKCTIKQFQIRIDFNTFTIAGPTTIASSVASEIGGSIVPFVGPTGGVPNVVPVTLASNCLTDTFSLTGPGGSVPPVICGTNTGQHSKKPPSFIFLFFSLNYFYTS